MPRCAHPPRDPGRLLLVADLHPEDVRIPEGAKSRPPEGLLHEPAYVPKPRPPFMGLRDDCQDLQDGPGMGRGEGGREEDGGGEIEEVFPDHSGQQDERAEEAEGLAEGPDRDVGDAGGDPPASGADCAEGMGLVHDGQESVALLQAGEEGRVEEIPVHAEDRFGDDRRLPLRTLLQLLLQMKQVPVPEARHLGPAQGNSLDAARMDVPVDQDPVPRLEERGEKRQVRLEAAGAEERVLIAEELGAGLFRLPDQGGVSRHETRGRG